MTAVATLISTIALIGLYTYADILYFRQIFLIKNICFAVFSFFGAFMIVSGILFAFDIYSLWLTYAVCIIIGAGAAAYFQSKNRTAGKPAIAKIGLAQESAQESVQKSAQESAQAEAQESARESAQAEAPCGKHKNLPHICLAALLLLGFLVSLVKFGFWGMGQDQGVYQTAAIYRTAGYNSLQIDLSGYHKLTDDNDNVMFNAALTRARHYFGGDYGNLLGYYMDNHERYFNSEPLGYASGYFHGYPNYPAMLSISGRIFGVSGMAHIQSLFMLASIGLLFLLLYKNLKLKLFTSTAITGLFTISPVIVWTAKATLLECFLTLVIIALLYLVTARSKQHDKLLWMPVAVYSFSHVSAYTLMPVFVLLFFIIYLQNRERHIITTGIISCIAYFAGFFKMLFTNNGYTINLYRTPMREGGLYIVDDWDYSMFLIFVTVLALAAIAFLVISKIAIKRFDMTLNRKAFMIVTKYVIIVCLLYIAVRYLYSYLNGVFPNSLLMIRGILSSSTGTTIVVFAFLSGFIILPVVLLWIFRRKDILSASGTAAVTLLFTYCVVIYSTLLRMYIYESYYYPVRYLAPFIPVILVMGALCLDSMKLKYNIAVSCISILLTMPFAFFVATNKDKTRIEWNTFNQIAAAVNELDENDTVIVSRELLRYFLMPLDALTDAVILPEINGHYSFAAEKLSGGHATGTGRVFVLSRKIETDNTVAFRTQTSNYIPTYGFLPPLPVEAVIDSLNIRLSEITDVSQSVNITEPEE